MRIEHTVEIDRPVDEVFAFMASVENLPSWAENTVQAEQTSAGPVGEGTTCRVVNRAMGQQLDHRFVVTEYEPNRRYAARSTSGPFPMALSYTVEPAGAGTRLHVVSEAEPGGLMKLAGPMIDRMARRQIAVDHANLKRLLESRSGAGG